MPPSRAVSNPRGTEPPTSRSATLRLACPRALRLSEHLVELTVSYNDISRGLRPGSRQVQYRTFGWGFEMTGELRVTGASVQYEESPAEDPDGPFLNKPCLKFFLSLAFHEPDGPPVTARTRFLLTWSAKLIFVRTVMRTIARVWAPETGSHVPDQPTAMEFQFRLPLSKGAATVPTSQSKDSPQGPA